MEKSRGKKKAVAGAEKLAARRRGGPEAIREHLVRLDEELVRLIDQRARLVIELGKSGQPPAGVTFAAGTTAAAIDQLAEKYAGVLPKPALAAVLREVYSACRALVRPLRVAYLGPPYSFSHLAAIERFGRAVDFNPVGTIAAVFEEVSRGQADYGLVPLENSTDGRVADTLDMFSRMPMRICGTVEMRIHHALLGKCPRSEVQEVYSRPQALSQCRNWLSRHLPGARLVEVTSTTTAAQLAGQKPGAAAVASVQAAVEYGLDVLAENIEDNPWNTTRFAVISRSDAPPRTGHDRTAILFQVEHRPGALAEAMNIFKRNRVNLTWIESFPVPGSDRAYLFFAEMEGHQTDSRLRRAFAALQRKALRMELLGSFPATTTIG
jgi:chorismate mutase/prephenate dehydratase